MKNVRNDIYCSNVTYFVIIHTGDERVLAARKEEHELRGLTGKPTIFHVDDRDSPICYLRMDEIVYKFGTLLEAINISLQLHMILNVSNAHECNRLTYFYNANMDAIVFLLSIIFL